MNLRAKWEVQTEQRAKRELVEKLLEGKKVGYFSEHDLECVIQDAYQRNAPWTERRLFELLANLKGGDASERIESIHDWLKQECEFYVDTHPDLVNDYLHDEAREAEEVE